MSRRSSGGASAASSTMKRARACCASAYNGDARAEHAGGFSSRRTRMDGQVARGARPHRTHHPGDAKADRRAERAGAIGLGGRASSIAERFRRLHPCRMKLQMYKLEALPQQSQIIVYRLVQECCNNIGKHSGANQVNICVHFADGVLRLYVE